MNGQSFDDCVLLETLKDLVVSKVSEFRQVQDGMILDQLVILMVVNFGDTFSNEVKLFHVRVVWNDNPTMLKEFAEKADDKFVGEAPLAILEEVVEIILKLGEGFSQFDQTGLHFRGDLLIEVEFLNDEVKVIPVGLLDVFSDVVVQVWLQVERVVRFLDLFDPHIKCVKFLLDEIAEGV